MKRLTIQALQSQPIRKQAESLVYYDLASNPHDFARIVSGWIRRHIVIVDEFEEYLQSPIILVDEIREQGRAFGDCDDVAMLGAALLGSLGAFVRFRAIDEQTDGSFGHVFTEFAFPRDQQYYPFDPTINCLPVWEGNSITVDIIS